METGTTYYRPYPRREGGPLLADRGDKIRVFRIHGYADEEYETTIGNELKDKVPSDQGDIKLPGRPHMVISEKIRNVGSGRFICVPTTSNARKPLTFDAGRYGIHYAMPNCFPTDHDIVKDFFWKDPKRRTTVDRLVNKNKLDELSQHMRETLVETVRKIPSGTSISVGPFPQGAVVGVSFGHKPTKRIPCVVLSSPFTQVQLARFNRITVIQTIPYSPEDDEAEKKNPHVLVLRPPTGGLTENRTLSLYLVRTIDSVARKVQLWNKYQDKWDWRRPSSNIGLTSAQLQKLRNGIFRIMWSSQNEK